MTKPRTVVGEDVLAAVRAMLAESPTTEAKTAKEWADEWTMSHSATIHVIHKAIEAGLMTATSVMRHDMAGRKSWRPAYWISKAATRSKP